MSTTSISNYGAEMHEWNIPCTYLVLDKQGKVGPLYGDNRVATNYRFAWHVSTVVRVPARPTYCVSFHLVNNLSSRKKQSNTRLINPAWFMWCYLWLIKISGYRTNRRSFAFTCQYKKKVGWCYVFWNNFLFCPQKYKGVPCCDGKSQGLECIWQPFCR